MERVITRMSVWVYLVSIKKFQIYSEDANGETQTRNPWITNPVL